MTMLRSLQRHAKSHLPSQQTNKMLRSQQGHIWGQNKTFFKGSYLVLSPGLLILSSSLFAVCIISSHDTLPFLCGLYMCLLCCSQRDLNLRWVSGWRHGGPADRLQQPLALFLYVWAIIWWTMGGFTGRKSTDGTNNAENILVVRQSSAMQCNLCFWLPSTQAIGSNSKVSTWLSFVAIWTEGNYNIDE